MARWLWCQGESEAARRRRDDGEATRRGDTRKISVDTFDPVPYARLMRTKLSILQGHMRAGEWKKAIALAAKFPRLGIHRAAILDAHTAIINPSFTRQLRRDCIAAGIAALRLAYGG